MGRADHRAIRLAGDGLFTSTDAHGRAVPFLRLGFLAVHLDELGVINVGSECALNRAEVGGCLTLSIPHITCSGDEFNLLDEEKITYGDLG